MSPYFYASRAVRGLIMVFLLAAVSACGVHNGAQSIDENGIFDPYETHNRKVHAFNRGLDKGLIRPVGRSYTKVLPDPIEDNISNFAQNLSQPSIVVNSILQGDIRGAGLATTRFLTNTILGFGGIADAAAELKLPEHDTDFGETLYTWGVGEGAYVELPLLGPSTQRDTTGKIVDLFTNPLSYAVDSPDKYVGTVATAAKRLGDRGRYSDTVDSILYDSADSYAQARLIYLQNRRFELGSSGETAGTDPYSDPYEDPYAN